MKKILSITIILFCSQLIAQNSIYIGTKKYSATDEWQFTVENGYPEIGNATITFAKNGTSGFLMISVDTHHPLRGDVMIYLDNGEAILCKDTKMKDMHDGFTVGIYNLTSSEIVKMKNSNISSIRVSIFQYSISMYSFTIKNYYKEKPLYGSSFNGFNTTAYEIEKLMNNN
jgi:hypothetical protein